MPVTLGYWRMRGLAHPARLMLKYAGVEFEDVRYVNKEDPLYDPSIHTDWFDVKFKLGLAFPNIPYYIDGNLKLSQSSAIYRYLARKHNLYGSTEDDRVLVDMASEQIADIRNAVYAFVYYANDKQDYEEKKKQYEEDLPTKLKQFDDFLGDKTWLIGDKLTYVDFQWYDMVDQHIPMCPGFVEKFPRLVAYHKRFEQLPAIKAYMASGDFLKSPMNDFQAYFTG